MSKRFDLYSGGAKIGELREQPSFSRGYEEGRVIGEVAGKGMFVGFAIFAWLFSQYVSLYKGIFHWARSSTVGAVFVLGVLVFLAVLTVVNGSNIVLAGLVFWSTVGLMVRGVVRAFR